MLSFVSFFFITCHSQLLNQYIKGTGPNGEDLWNSTSDFKPQYPVYTPETYFDSGFGKIKLGQQMSIEFDFLFHGRTESEVQCPDVETENFFRIGRTAYFDDGCSGEGSHYPSFSLAPICGIDVLEIGFSTSTQCPDVMHLFDYGQGSISTTESHHIKITMNNSLIMVEITGGGQPYFVKTQERTETRAADLGYEAPIWFMSNKRLPATDQYNLGNATFSNIKIISNVFDEHTLSPTPSPTHYPTKNPFSPFPAQSTLHSLESQTNEPTLHPIMYTTTQSENISVHASSPNTEWPYLLILGSAGFTLAILCIFLFYKLIKLNKLKTETFKLNNELNASSYANNDNNNQRKSVVSDENDIFSSCDHCDIVSEEGLSDNEAIKDLTVPSNVINNKTSKIRQYALKPNEHGNQLNIIRLHYGEKHRSPEFTVSNSSALYMSHHHPVETEGNVTMHMPNLTIDIDEDEANVIMHDIVTSNDGELSFSANIKLAQSFNQKHAIFDKDSFLKIDIPETVEEIIENEQITKNNLNYSDDDGMGIVDDETSESSMSITIQSMEEYEHKTALPPPPKRKNDTKSFELKTMNTPIEPIVDAQKILHSLQTSKDQKLENGKITKGISADLISPKLTKGHWM